MSEMQVGSSLPPSLEGARTILLAIIRERQTDSANGVRSTQVGAEFSKRAGVPFEPYINAAVLVDGAEVPPSHRKMRPFVEHYCKDIIEYVPDPSGNGFVRERGAESSPGEGRFADSAAPIPRYRKSIWLAFVRPLPPRLKRYINLGDRAGFTDVSAQDPPEADWLEVEREFIASIPQDQAIDPARVHGGIMDWIKRHDVDVARLLEPDLIAGRKATVADLVRIIDSLPDSIAADWSIPAIVVKHLAR